MENIKFLITEFLVIYLLMEIILLFLIFFLNKFRFIKEIKLSDDDFINSYYNPICNKRMIIMKSTKYLFTSKLPFTLIFHYYIRTIDNNYKPILRFSKNHKLIKNKYKELNKNERI